MSSSYIYQEPSLYDLWADPIDFAEDHGITVEEATDLIAGASWVLTQLTGGAYHGPGCWDEYYIGVTDCEVNVKKSPVVDVSLVEWTHDCRTSSSPIEGACIVGRHRISICCNSSFCRPSPCGCEPMLHIVYEVSSTLPPGSSAVAAALAGEYLNASQGKPCALPERVTNVSRQGVSWTILDPQDFLEKGLTGIASVDHWLSAARHGNPVPRPRVIEPWAGRFVSSDPTTCINPLASP